MKDKDIKNIANRLGAKHISTTQLVADRLQDRNTIARLTTENEQLKTDLAEAERDLQNVQADYGEVEAERDSLRTQLTAVEKRVRKIVESRRCSDGGCIWGPPKGMHTNGGCQTLKMAKPEIWKYLRELACDLRVLQDSKKIIISGKTITNIPKGIYCYDENGVCQYWSLDNNKPKQENGYCSYLEYGDWEPDGWMSLLWDQIKECGLKVEDSDPSSNEDK